LISFLLAFSHRKNFKKTGWEKGVEGEA
jgi:hypothetical protein